MLNNNALTKLTALQDSIRRSGEMDVSIHADWENSGVENLIQTLRDDMNASKQAKLDRLRQQLEEAKALPDGDKAEQLRDRLRQRIRETENRTYLPMTVDQLRMLKSITASTLHIIRTENKTLSLARAEEVDGMAMKAAREVLNSEGNGFGEKFEKAKGAMNRYQLDMLGGTRMFRRLGGYTKNGQMEKLGQMLNDGQRRQTEILVEGESLFANVTGKEHLKEVEAFAGPGAELVDIGLKDSKGNAPTKVGDLTNDKKYQTETEVSAAINKAVAAADHLKRKTVASTGDIDLKAADAAQYIYMVPKGTAGTSDKYDEYMVIDGVLEKMGDWKVDLSGYVQKEAGKGLSTNDYTSADKQKVTNMEKTMDARITASMATDTEVNAMLDELFGS